jgi:hypothetical protein
VGRAGSNSWWGGSTQSGSVWQRRAAKAWQQSNSSAHPLLTLTACHPPLRFLDRPYGRVDRPKLKRTLLERCVAAGEG